MPLHLTKDIIKSTFSQTDYSRGTAYFHQGRANHILTNQSGNKTEVIYRVRGGLSYDVKLVLKEENFQYSCTCPKFDDYGKCKHIVAALLDYIETEQTLNDNKSNRLTPPSPPTREKAASKSDLFAQRMLNSYIGKTSTSGGIDPTRSARLSPCISFQADMTYPTLSFQVGFDRLYVIRDIKNFLYYVCRSLTSAYGKGLTLYHGIEQFDTISQGIIHILMDQFPEFRASRVAWGTLDYIPYNSAWKKNTMTLSGSGFDRLFDLLYGQDVLHDVSGKTIQFQRDNPEITLSLDRTSAGALLKIDSSLHWHFFGNNQSLYAWNDTQLLKCSPVFQQKVFPLLSTGTDAMVLALHDLPAFCSYVLPEIKGHITVEDPNALLDEYLPDECIPCFYFDLDDTILSLRLAFRYGDQEFPADKPANKTPDVKRSLCAEQDVVSQVARQFEQNGALFSLSGDDAIYDFLTGGFDRFHAMGEVFVTDRLREKRVQPKPGTVGVSVSSGGLLEITLDTGGFPPEELEALYQSLLKKRRYHRLADGRYMTLDGSPSEKLAEMAHMLQLPAEDLASGKVTMPAFRGLYLDGLLSGESGLRVNRDRQFREMVRSFKSVADSDYALPEPLEPVLRPYQRVGFQWLKTLESCGFGGILADEMGLGKTLQMIAFLFSAERGGLASLVVCPASLILNWADELARFAPDLRVTLIMGTAAERKKQLAEKPDSDVWVTSYELLRQDIKLYAELEFYCCILDEGQHIKNQSTLASKAVKQVVCRQRFILTGTPIENRLSELWNLFDFLMPGYLFSHRSFVEKLEKPAVKSGDAAAAEQLRKLVQPFMLRRLKRDVLKELPPKIEHVRRVALAENERKVYLAAALEARNALAAGEQGKLAILAALTRLRQICCAPGLCFENYTGPASKLDACIELCASMAENGHQILLFSQFTSMLDLIRDRLNQLRISNFTLQGSTSKEQRARLVQDFNKGAASVFLISLKAGGTGLNLTAADVVIHYDPWWNLAAQEQATDRAHRIGQQSSVQVYKLIAENTIEEKILKLQEKKAELMDMISDGSEASILNMSAEDLLALLE